MKNPPHSFDDLLKLKNGKQIVIEDPRSSTPGLGLLLWVKSIYKDRAKEYWYKLSPKILTITKGWSEAYDLFLKGEADMVLSYTTSPAYHIIAEKKYNYKYAHFKEGHYMQIEVAAILKSSKQKNLAQKFMRFMLSSKFADIIPTTNWMYPVAKTSKPLPKPFLDRPKKSIILSSEDISKHKKEYIQEWLDGIKK
jgi:thiamine transport system substrate-binding protein